MKVPRAIMATSFVVVCLTSPARADKPTKVEIAQKGKAATAFLEIAGRPWQTAFCVHSSGLFVTTEKGIRGANESTIKLVVDSGLKNQRVCKVSVIRVSTESNLALLLVKDPVEFTSLTLGSIETVVPGLEVVVCGFPHEGNPAIARTDYPSATVSTGKANGVYAPSKNAPPTSLNLAFGSANPGGSGGPVIDDLGKVVGMVRVASIAIPVNNLRSFLTAPQIQFSARELSSANLDKAIDFKASVQWLLPDAKEPTVRLLLRAGDEEARSFPMKLQDGNYVASAAPIAKKRDGQVEVEIRMASGLVTGMIDDSIVKIGDRPIRLSGIRRIDRKAKTEVHLAGNKIVEGEISGLGPMEVTVGDEKIKVDLSKAVQLRITPPAELVAITAEIVASVAGKDVARMELPIPIGESGRIVTAQAPPVSTTAPPKDVNVRPDPMPAPAVPAIVAPSNPEKVVKRLPDAFSDLCVGGGGRYLIFHLPKLRKLAAFDTTEQRIAHYVPVDDDKVVFAAGMDKLVIGLGKKGVLERWSLETFEREVEIPMPVKDEARWMSMGHASHGPVAVNGEFLDLNTLKPLSIELPRMPKDIGRLYPSADGTVFTRPGQTAAAFVLGPDKPQRYDGNFGGHVAPGPDGSRMFTIIGVFTASFADPPAYPLPRAYSYCVPAVRDNYYLTLTSADDGKGGGATVFMKDIPAPIARLDSLTHGLRFSNARHEEFGAWQRIYLIPQANVIAVLPISNDQVVLHKFDIDEALEKSGVDYLLVTSQPPRTVKIGIKLEYPIVVKAKQKPVTFKLDSGPKGMAVTSEGVVTWAGTANVAEEEVQAIVNIRDARGQEQFHSFTVRVVK
jgi:S1-C subfamily serine protease